MQHVVKKQVFDLTINQGLNAFHIQEKVSNHFQNQIVPMLKKIFDERSTGEAVTVVDRIEINLGTIDAEKIETEKWTEGLKEQIEKLLDGLTVPHGHIIKRAEVPLRLSVLKQWFYYMQHGYLAWTTLTINENWYRQALEALAVDYESVQQLRHIINNEQQPLKRIVLQHHETYLKSLAEILTAQTQVTLVDAINELIILSNYAFRQWTLPVNFSENNLRNQYWTQVLQIAAKYNPVSSKTLVQELVASVVAEHSVTIVPPPHILSKLNVTGNLVEDFVKVLQTEQQIKGKKGSKKNQHDNRETKTSNADNKDPHNLEEANKSKRENRIEQKDTRKKEVLLNTEDKSNQTIRHLDGDGTMVLNAGLVLLHPFLKTGFTRMGLLDGKQFIDDPAREKALYMLHYLATGKKEAEEHELVIPKIICDFPMEQAVNTNIEITDEVYKEADELLDAVISQWEKLQNASHGALREGFLQRSGKLSERNQEDLIQVEKSSIDILLNYLPWSLSLIMLPWRKELLRVEWY